jgi:hypothetical protein
MNVTVSFRLMHTSSQTKTPPSSVIANLHTPKAQLSMGTVEAGEGAFWRKGSALV